jgi:hypothetical protein
VSLELGYGYFCGNVVDEDDAWVSSDWEISKSPFYLLLMILNMSLSTTYKMLWLGGVWWTQGISSWGPKERSEACQENGVWKEEWNAGKIFEDATELDS